MPDRDETSAIGPALRESERGAARSGLDANVEKVLDCARQEISSSSLRSLWQDAPEFSNDFRSRDVYDRCQWQMMEAMNLPSIVDGHVVGHALMRASEAGTLHVLRSLRKGQRALTCSVLVPRFLAFSLLKAAELGNLDVVQELLRDAELAQVGYEIAEKAKVDGYPNTIVNLTRDWQGRVRQFKTLLPGAKYVLNKETLVLQCAQSEDESVHEGLRECYRVYGLWRLMIVAGANGHGGVFREFLMKKEEAVVSKRRSLMGYEHPKVAEYKKIRARIDEEYSQFLMKVTAKLSRDQLLYEVYRSSKGMTKQGSSPWRCNSKAQFGLWEVVMEVPVLLMEPEGSYQDNDKRQLMRRYRYIKPIVPQMMKLNVQFKIVIEIQPNHCELTVAVNHVRVTFDNQRWEVEETGHFPTRVSLSVTPIAPTLTSVSMTGSSANTSYKVGAAEQVRVGVNATLKAAPTAGISFQAGKTTTSKVEGKPWRMEQLPIYNERGGSYTWQLTNLHGTPFDRLNPMLQETKKSIWQFGKRIPINPLLVLPFGTNGGVNFTGSEFDDSLSWRFSKELENTMVAFNVEGQVHTTYITQNTFWETRVVPFEVKLEQKLEPCGDPAAGDKKKKKKKK